MDTGGNFIQIAAKLGSRAVEESRSAVHDQVEERIELESTSVQIEGDDKDKQQEKEKEKEKDEGKNKEPK